MKVDTIRAFLYHPKYMVAVFDSVRVDVSSNDPEWDELVMLAREGDWGRYLEIALKGKREMSEHDEYDTWIFKDAWPCEGYYSNGTPVTHPLPISPNYTDDHDVELSNAPDFTKNKIEMYQIESGATIGTYDTVKQAYQRTAIDSSNIRKVLRGERESAGGYGWRLAGTDTPHPVPLDVDDASREIPDDETHPDYEDWIFKKTLWDKIT